MPMKKTIFYLFLAFVMAACGVGLNNSSSTFSNGASLYGFNAEGVPFVATVNSQSAIYEYRKVNTTTGETSAAVQLKIDAVPGELNVYKVYDHGDHFLALDSSQKTLLASTRTSDTAQLEPTLFALQPLVNFRDIAGSYYIRSYGPFWYRLNVLADGSFNIDCKSFSAIEILADMPFAFDACEGITFSQVSLQALSAPYWRLDFQYNLSGIDGYFTQSTTLLFANSASGRVAYTGTSTSGSCPFGGSAPCSLTNDNGASIWQESQNFNTSVTYGGTWLFNRQGGDSSQLSLNDAGTGTTASGLTAFGHFSSALANIDQTRNIYHVNSFSTTVTSFIDTASMPNSVTALIPYGRSSLRGLGGNTAVETSTINEDALFRRVLLETKTFTIIPNGTSGPFSISASPSEAARIRSIELSVDTYDLSGSMVMTSNPLSSGYDYWFDIFNRQVTLRSPISFVDSQGRQVRLSVKAVLTPVGIKADPVSWGVRIR
jgi:hypothetical protein